MTPERREKLVNYIARALTFASNETRLIWPKDLILVTSSYNELSEIDRIMDIPIYIMDMPSSFDFFVAFPFAGEKYTKLQKEFLNFIELYSIDNK